MKHVGIICEYNPFHTGHARLLRAVSGAEAVVCVMSGNFTQRGEAAILPPVTRAAMAIEGGADLVLELPFPFAASSARYFATAGVRVLASLGVDTVAFGSERGDLAALRALADRAPDLSREEGAPQNMGDAAAYLAALGENISSNDILGVEYLRAMRTEAPWLEAFALKREGAQYRETGLDGSDFPSATALRAALEEGCDISGYLPAQTRALFAEAAAHCGLARTDRLGTAMLALLRTVSAQDTRFAGIAACGGGLLGRLSKAAFLASDYNTLCREAATKRYTDGRIRRALLYLLSGVTPADLAAHPVYVRLLAANARGREFLAKTERTRTVHVVTKQSEIAALGSCAARQRELSLIADGLFALCFADTVTPHGLQTARPYLV